MVRTPLRFYEFGPFRVNATERLLQRDNETIPLTPKVLDTLLVLVENSGRVMTKDALMQLLWPDSFVEESSLTQNISLLRRALGQAGDGQPYIETIPKRGYRFIAEVSEREDSGSEIVMLERTTTQVVIEEHEIENGRSIFASQARVPGHRGALKVGGAMAVVVATVSVAAFLFISFRNRAKPDAFVPQTIAVLPFKIIGEQNEPQQLSLGMADALVIRLSKLEKPIVLPTSSVARYATEDRDDLSIGKELGVDGVIVGTLQRDGDRVRVSAQLIRLSDGKTVWSGRFDESFRSNFALQDSISNQMAEALVEQIAKDSRQRLATRLTENAEAYQAYVMGIYFWNRRTKDDLTKAIVHLNEAVHKDDTFALAHAYLADCYYLSSANEYEILSRSEELIRSESEANKAIALDDTIAEAHTVKAGLLMMRDDRDAADQEFRRALELKPSSAVGHIRYGYFLFAGENLKAAIEHMQRARELDPAGATSNAALGHMLEMARDDDRAISCNRRALELQPDLGPAHINLAEILVRNHRFEEALSEFEKFKDAPPLLLMTEKAYLYAAGGRRSQALQLLSQLRKLNAAKVRPYDWIVLYAALGDKKAAFGWLDKIKLGCFNRARLKYDPQLDPLREDDRFAGFLARNQIEQTASRVSN